LFEALAEGRLFQYLILDAALPKSSLQGLLAIGNVHPELQPLQLCVLAPPNHAMAGMDFNGAVRLNKPLRLKQLRSELHLGTEEAALESFPPAVPRLLQGNILIAEDNQVNQRLASSLARKCGLTADVVFNGKEAVEALRNKRYDFVLMDCQMPGMDGWEATARIRALPGDAASTPVIALTANAMTGDRERCLAAGMNDYLTKPISFIALQTVAARYIVQPEAAGDESTDVLHSIPHGDMSRFLNPEV
jgi:CheY-like chemotaxis protein